MAARGHGVRLEGLDGSLIGETQSRVGERNVLIPIGPFALPKIRGISPIKIRVFDHGGFSRPFTAARTSLSLSLSFPFPLSLYFLPLFPFRSISQASAASGYEISEIARRRPSTFSPPFSS